MEDNNLYAWIWGIVAIVAVVAIASLTYYNLEAKSNVQISNEFKVKKLEFQQTMVKDYNVSPAVLECLERDWDNVSVYQICKEVLSNSELTREEAERLVEKAKGLDK